MADALAHRGPDGAGFHAEPGLALGHRRLAIVDLAGGYQPMALPDGDLIVSFNGEIFNHDALRTELKALGHVFRSRSDTEVLLHGWRQWGLGCLDRLNGQFAFAIWDRTAGTLVLTRDRLGEKPMHYARLPDGTIAFASEIAGLLTLPSLPRDFDPAAIDDFLAFGYVPDPATVFAAVRRLPPAHALVLQRGAVGLPSPHRYWRPPVSTAGGPADAPTELLSRLRQATAMRLMADVPLGCFLSGGIDSAGIATLAAEGHAGLDTFTIGLPGAVDERPVAAAVAAGLKGRHHDELAGGDLLDNAAGICGIFGEPFGDSSAVPTLAVCRLARRHVTVALSGDGGDEVFAGYRRHRWHLLVDGVRRLIPARLRRPLLGGLARIYPKLDRAPRWLRARHTLTELSLDSALGYYATVARMGRARRHALYSPKMRSEIDGHDPSDRFVSLMAECDPDEPLLQAQYADLHTWLPGDILTKVDRTSMAVSLEVRPPLLDHTLVEWGMALPVGLKLRGSQGKQILRDALAPLLPPIVLDRPKQGFAAPLGVELRARMAELRTRLLGPAMLDGGLFDASALARLMDEHASGRFDHGQALWQLLVLQGFLAEAAGRPMKSAMAA